MLGLVEGSDDGAFLAWRTALHGLTSDKDVAKAWRRSRYTFAHRLGEALTVASHGRPAMEGPLIYGVWLRWGLLYVGQTREGERRLRDLPVGESHHLANTFPPEIWHKVVVIAWPRLAEAERLAGVLQPDLVGLALEHRLQNELRPLANSERRKSDGSWREVDWRASSSRGARTAHAVDDLFHAVRQVWDEAASRSEQDEHASAVCRVVFPETLLPQD